MVTAKVIPVAVVCLVLFSALVILMELEVVQLGTAGESHQNVEGLFEPATLGQSYISFNPATKIRLPNQGRSRDGKTRDDVGSRSVHYGTHQGERQRWLEEEARRLRDVMYGTMSRKNSSTTRAGRNMTSDRRRTAAPVGETEGAGEGRMDWELDFAPVDGRGESGGGKGGGAVNGAYEERWHRLRMGAELWNSTYVPPIAPEEKRRLVDKWSGVNASNREGGKKGRNPGAPRILYVITSFDRGRRLGRKISQNVDKLDFVLMMADEMRETCEAGFSPQVHLITAWDTSKVKWLIEDRLFCSRTGQVVPITYEKHSPKLADGLSSKHRLYMQSRLNDHDLFIQVEDDMILTINHILLYLEETEKLTTRRGSGAMPNYQFAPGFIRTEPAPGEGGVGGEASRRGGEWYEWEIILSRFRGGRFSNLGAYLTLDKSKVLRYAGNNQALWMATQGQLRYLHQNCRYLDYDEKAYVFVEYSSGSLQMFSSVCKMTKVFPADHFEDFLVHHRTNNKNGKRGESVPGVPMGMLRLWVDQILRDSAMLKGLDTIVKP